MKPSFLLIYLLLITSALSNLCSHSPPPDAISQPDLQPTVTWEPFNNNFVIISFTHPSITQISGKCNYAIKFYEKSFNQTYGRPYDSSKDYTDAFTFSSNGTTNTCTYQKNLTVKSFGIRNFLYYQIAKLDRFRLKRRLVKCYLG